MVRNLYGPPNPLRKGFVPLGTCENDNAKSSKPMAWMAVDSILERATGLCEAGFIANKLCVVRAIGVEFVTRRGSMTADGKAAKLKEHVYPCYSDLISPARLTRIVYQIVS